MNATLGACGLIYKNKLKKIVLTNTRVKINEFFAPQMCLKQLFFVHKICCLEIFVFENNLPKFCRFTNFLY